MSKERVAGIGDVVSLVEVEEKRFGKPDEAVGDLVGLFVESRRSRVMLSEPLTVGTKQCKTTLPRQSST
jgi:hypothetical protein